MARETGDISSVARIPRERQLSTDAARTRLYKLVAEMSSLRSGRPSLLERAVEVGPRGTGGAVLIPRADVDEFLDRAAEREDRIEQLQDEVEDLSLAQLVSDRIETPEEDLLSVEELAAEVDRGHLVETE